MSIVNQSYAAACIEKLLIKKGKNGQAVLTAANIDPEIITGLLTYLCTVLNEQKNLYAMRALFRVVQLSSTQVLQFSDTLGGTLNKFITDMASDENDQSPNYAYILFETTALTLKFLRTSPDQMA